MGSGDSVYGKALVMEAKGIFVESIVSDRERQTIGI